MAKQQRNTSEPSSPYSPKQKHYSLPLIRRLLLSFFFALTILSITLHLIYLYTEQSQIYSSKSRTLKHLHSAFDKNPYSTTIQTLHDNQYTILRSSSSCSECIVEIVDYLGLKDQKVVVNRDYRSLEGFREKAIPILWRTRMMIKHYVADPQPQAKIWVFWINKQIPKSQIQQIVRLEPQSSIILVTNSKNKIAVKGFKDAGKVDNFDLVKILKSAKIPKKQAQVYINYYNQSVSAIFNKITPNSLTLKSQTPILSQLSKKTRQILTKLCKSGQGEIKLPKLSTKVKNQLQSSGVQILTESKKLQWKTSRNILKYMLQSYQNCRWDREIYAVKDQKQQQRLAENQEDQTVVDKTCVCPVHDVKVNQQVGTDKGNNQGQANVNVGQNTVTNNNQKQEETQEEEQEQEQETAQTLTEEQQKQEQIKQVQTETKQQKQQNKQQTENQQIQTRQQQQHNQSIQQENQIQQTQEAQKQEQKFEAEQKQQQQTDEQQQKQEQESINEDEKQKQEEL